MATTKKNTVTTTADVHPKPEKTFTAILDYWTEHERGWGQRPDGETVSLTREDHDAYVKAYNAKFNSLPDAPNDYTSCDNSPRLVRISEALYKKLMKAENHTIWLPHGTRIVEDAVILPTEIH